MYKRRRKEGMYKIVSSPWLDLLGKAEDYRRNDLNCFKDTINIFFLALDSSINSEMGWCCNFGICFR
jgi:hypothetical protein